MLILTRKLGESITIGNEIKVTVVDCQGKQIKLGITAPKDIKVHREEIFEKIQEENKKAATVSRDALAKIAQKWRTDKTKKNVKEKEIVSAL
ncbi:MAG: carbon storage regulator CsrA [Candidatus Brocadia sp.]|nr:carbon storage regulator CsrA [Candidatus Brocadia sp.]